MYSFAERTWGMTRDVDVIGREQNVANWANKLEESIRKRSSKHRQLLRHILSPTAKADSACLNCASAPERPLLRGKRRALRFCSSGQGKKPQSCHPGFPLPSFPTQAKGCPAGAAQEISPREMSVAEAGRGLNLAEASAG